jgi:hypothetical protein
MQVSQFYSKRHMKIDLTPFTPFFQRTSPPPHVGEGMGVDRIRVVRWRYLEGVVRRQGKHAHNEGKIGMRFR